MKVVLTGGGTGGHITPILAVARELKKSNPGIEVVYIGERGGKFRDMVKDNDDIDESYSVFAGKFRRYHGESLITRILDIKTLLLNVRDAFLFVVGVIESIILIKRLSPDAVFLKGGFVGVPTGLASALWRVPFMTHDSDAVPGLANKLVGRWAKIHATALPIENYSYPSSKTKQVGVIVSSEFKFVDEAGQKEYKTAIGVPASSKLLLVTGGSSGAESINIAFSKIVDRLLGNNKDLHVIHQTGRGKSTVYGDYKHDRLIVEELLFPLHQYMGASDLVVTRAGANTLAELGIQGKASIVIPNPYLTNAHQTKNAKFLAKQGAIEYVKDTTVANKPEVLLEKINELLSDERYRLQLGSSLGAMIKADAAKEVSMLLLKIANK